MLRFFMLVMLGGLCTNYTFTDSKLRCDNGLVSIQSKAPLELIEAQSKQLQGIVDPASGNFAWSVEMNSFEGFNSPLQREHFNENYAETNQFPKATFTGKIIESVDFSRNGTYEVRTKGKLTIHGVTQERIIKCTLDIAGSKVRVRSTFSVKLADHNISIPKIVYQKIAEEVFLTIDASLK